MEYIWPRGLESQRAEQLLSKAGAQRAAAPRAGLFSELLLDCPYQANALIGSAGTPEVFAASLEAFDCVTYVETVLALSRASRVSEFVEWLRKIRYEDGQVEWKRRHHYMTCWIRGNARIHAVRRVPAEGLATRKDRLLDGVSGLPPRQARFWCVPKPRIKKFQPRLRTGDLIFFASTRPHLDVFHCGVLVGRDGGFRMRHAARSRQGVVEQDLEEFLGSNRMSGVIVARPIGEIEEGKP